MIKELNAHKRFKHQHVENLAEIIVQSGKILLIHEQSDLQSLKNFILDNSHLFSENLVAQIVH